MMEYKEIQNLPLDRLRVEIAKAKGYRIIEGDGMPEQFYENWPIEPIKAYELLEELIVGNVGPEFHMATSIEQTSVEEVVVCQAHNGPYMTGRT